MSARPTTRVVTRLLFVVAITLAVLAPATAAFAGTSRQNYPPSTPTTKAAVQTNVPTDPETLPFTGGDVALLTVIGVGVLIGGVLLVVTSRRRSRSAA
jgi:beta-lactamase regulating signal transducer with metallopeptidase domain